MDYSYEDLLRMENEALNRVQEMQRNAQRTVNRANEELLGRNRQNDYAANSNEEQQNQNVNRSTSAYHSVMDSVSRRGSPTRHIQMPVDIPKETRREEPIEREAETSEHTAETAPLPPPANNNPQKRTQMPLNIPKQNAPNRNMHNSMNNPLAFLKNLTGGLTQDNETLMLLGLAMLFNSEQSDSILMLAVLYILM